MLAGHCDQIGLIVQHIDDNGFIYVQPIGGWDPQVLIGQRMTVWTAGGPVQGVIARKPIHLLTEEERKQVPKLKELWIDIGAAKQGGSRRPGSRGRSGYAGIAFRELLNRRAASPAMDDKCGLWVVVEALRRADQAKLECGLYAVSTVQEEIGLRGAQTSAFGIDPQVGIAVDVTHATDCPTIEKKYEGDVALGKGPVIYRGPNMNPKVVERLFQAAADHQIPYQVAACGRATRHRRQRAASEPCGRGRGAGEHSQPLHAQPGGDDLVGRPGPCGRPAGPFRRKPAGRRGIDAVGRGQFWVKDGPHCGTDRKLRRRLTRAIYFGAASRWRRNTRQERVFVGQIETHRQRHAVPSPPAPPGPGLDQIQHAPRGGQLLRQPLPKRARKRAVEAETRPMVIAAVLGAAVGEGLHAHHAQGPGTAKLADGKPAGQRASPGGSGGESKSRPRSTPARPRHGALAAPPGTAARASRGARGRAGPARCPLPATPRRAPGQRGVLQRP